MEPGRPKISKDLFLRMLRDEKRLGATLFQIIGLTLNLQQYQQANYDAIAGTVRTERPQNEIRHQVGGQDCIIDNALRLLARCNLAIACVSADVVIEGPHASGMIHLSIQARKVACGSLENTYIGTDARLDCTIASRTIIKERASVGEGTVIGENVRLVKARSCVRICDCGPKNVASGAIVSMSLVYGAAGLAFRRRRRARTCESRNHA